MAQTRRKPAQGLSRSALTRRKLTHSRRALTQGHVRAASSRSKLAQSRSETAQRAIFSAHEAVLQQVKRIQPSVVSVSASHWRACGGQCTVAADQGKNCRF